MPPDLIYEVPPQSTGAQRREMARKKIVAAKADFITGDETIQELCARYTVEHRVMIRHAKAENWVNLRRQKREFHESRILAKFTGTLETNQEMFLGASSVMLNKLNKLINRELDRLEQGKESETMDNQGNVKAIPLLQDVLRVAKTMESFVEVGRKTYLLDVKVPEQQEGEVIDITPMKRGLIAG